VQLGGRPVEQVDSYRFARVQQSTAACVEVFELNFECVLNFVDRGLHSNERHFGNDLIIESIHLFIEEFVERTVSFVNID